MDIKTIKDILKLEIKNTEASKKDNTAEWAKWQEDQMDGRISGLRMMLSIIEGGEKSDGIISPIMQESDSERLLEAFIKETEREFPDTDFEYLRFIKDRVLASNGA